MNYEYHPSSATTPSDFAFSPNMNTNASSFSDLYPKDYTLFKDSMHQRLSSLEQALSTVREQLSGQSSQLTELLSLIEGEKD